MTAALSDRDLALHTILKDPKVCCNEFSCIRSVITRFTIQNLILTAPTSIPHHNHPLSLSCYLSTSRSRG